MSLEPAENMQQDQGRIDLRPAVALAFFIAWLAAYNVLGVYTWGYGKLSFFMLLTLAGLVGAAKVSGPRLAAAGARQMKALTVCVSLLAAGAAGWFLYGQFGVFESSAAHEIQSDIATNTLTAGMFAFDLHTNPYKSPAQTG